MDTIWFHSKIDWWLRPILVALPLIEVAAFVAGWASGDTEAVVAGLAGVGIVAAIYGLLVIPVRYGISADTLVIRFGVVRHSIALNTIVEVYPTHNPLSSPALSLDRLAIRTSGSRTAGLISPLEREEFLFLLAHHAGLARRGDRLVRE